MTEYDRGFRDGLAHAVAMASNFVVDGEIDCRHDPRRALDLLAEHIEERIARHADFAQMRS